MPAALVIALQALGLLVPLLPELKDEIEGFIALFKGGQVHLTADELRALGTKLDIMNAKVDAALAERLKTA